MSSNFVRFQEILNQAPAINFSCLTQKLVNPPLKSGSSFPNRDPLFIPQTTFVPTFRPHIISELGGVPYKTPLKNFSKKGFEDSINIHGHFFSLVHISKQV